MDHSTLRSTPNLVNEMNIEAKNRLSAAPYSRMLSVFDEEAATDPAKFKSLVKNWTKNKFLAIDAEIDAAFSTPHLHGRLDPKKLAALKAKLTALNELR
jgi:hypothetical protein